MGKFIVRNGDLEGRKFRLESGAKITLGRERADINFFDKRMSRRHCSLEVRDGIDFAVDLGSTNGTWVNNQRITEAELQPGDLLRVGFTELEFLGNPAPSMPVLPTGPAINPNQTIAFLAKDLLRPPPVERRKRFQGKSRLEAAKSAAMGKKSGQRQYISAKGKFCEACGEAIFVKEGAPDEGKVVDGLYLCRMCALISEKQKELGKDGLLPSYARIVGGRMGGAPAGDAPPGSGVPMEIIEEEVSLEDLTGPDESDRGEETAKGGDEPAEAAGGLVLPETSPEAPSPAVEAPPEAPVPAAPTGITEEEMRLEDLPPPEEGDEMVEARAGPAGIPAPMEVRPEMPPPAPEARPQIPDPVAPMEIIEEEVNLEDLIAPDEDSGKVKDEHAGAGPGLRPEVLPLPPPPEADRAAAGPAGEGAVAGGGPPPGNEPADPADAIALLDEMLRSAEDTPGTDVPPPGAEAPTGGPTLGPDDSPREVELPPGPENQPAAEAGDARQADAGPEVEPLKLPDDIRFEADSGGPGDGEEGPDEPKRDGDSEGGDGRA
ncbi:MAG: FHA domain-containing protein [Planctomycetota bacterium]